MKEYKISTFADLMQALRENPEWLEELRRMILTQELLELPKRFEEFRRRADERFGVFEKTFESFKRVVEERLGNLEKQMQEVKGRVEKLEKDLGVLKGMWLEKQVKKNIPSLFSEYLLNAKAVGGDKISKGLSLAVGKGIISKEERKDVFRLDLIIEGTLLNTEEPVLIAVEVSYTISKPDVQRAVRRAEILKRAMGKKVLPAVVGYKITKNAQKLLTKTGCLKVIAETPQEGK